MNDFEKFLRKEKILIADVSRTSRVGIARALSDLGAPTSQMVLVDSYAWAEEVVRTTRLSAVIVDYNLESRCGLDLFQGSPTSANRLTAIVTGNNSQAVVAHAAEGEVDVFISKPYTIESFREAFTQALQKKLSPSLYLMKIEEGRRYLEQSQLEMAREAFEEAMTLDPKPALACFYRGQVQALSKAIDAAQASFAKGLEYNEVHYKCLIGLHNALMSQGDLPEAYSVLRKIVRSFPLNPSRFSTLCRLAIATQKFEDVEEFHEIFLNLDSKGEDLTKPICAALVISGKKFLALGKTENALRLFSKAAVSSGSRPAFLKEIILALADHGLGQEIDRFLMRYPAQARSSTEFAVLDYLAVSIQRPLHIVLEHGRGLLKAGHRDPVIYKILAKATLQAGFQDHAESLLSEACRLWPEQAPEFEALKPGVRV